MANYQIDERAEPLILTVSGIDDSGPQHWQTLWQQQRDDIEKVELGMWSNPHRNSWVTKLNAAITQAARPVILVAHSLGCHAVAWWAALERPDYGTPVIGALMVAPPEVDNFPLDERLGDFGPTPIGILPFPSIVAASQNDPYISLVRAKRLASFWGSQFADAGAVGHINAESDIGDWSFGKYLLEQIERRTRQANFAGARADTPQVVGQRRPLIRDLTL